MQTSSFAKHRAKPRIEWTCNITVSVSKDSTLTARVLRTQLRAPSTMITMIFRNVALEMCFPAGVDVRVRWCRICFRRWCAVQVEGGKGWLAASQLPHCQDLSLTLNNRRRMKLERTSRWRWIRQALCITEPPWERQSLENTMLSCSSIGLGSPFD